METTLISLRWQNILAIWLMVAALYFVVGGIMKFRQRGTAEGTE